MFAHSATYAAPSEVTSNAPACAFYAGTAYIRNQLAYRSRRLAQQRLQEIQEARTARKTEEIQAYADPNEPKYIYAAIKTAYGPTARGTTPLLSADRTILFIGKTQSPQRWADHFRGVVNRPYTVSDAVIARLLQEETNADIDLASSLQETIKAV
nr:unnamed protein product [Spirometra erinaceieuropaei]